MKTLLFLGQNLKCHRPCLALNVVLAHCKIHGNMVPLSGLKGQGSSGLNVLLSNHRILANPVGQGTVPNMWSFSILRTWGYSRENGHLEGIMCTRWKGGWPRGKAELGRWAETQASTAHVPDIHREGQHRITREEASWGLGILSRDAWP